MSSLYKYNNKILKRFNKLANSSNCCCNNCKICQTIIDSAFDNQGVDCNKPPMFSYTATIPNRFNLPVMVNITGYVNDELLIDGSNNKDPGPYHVNFPGLPCNEAHDIGSLPGPFQDLVNGGITFPMNQRTFTIDLIDTVGAGGGLNIRVCINPYGAECENQETFIVSNI